jgi:pyruvate formate lyase activating enzyme
MLDGKIINISRFCTDDGPGIRTTVFLKGCPLKCLWCHNPESQNPDEECYLNGEKIGKTVSVQEIFDEIIKDKVFYETSGGGVTVSGGEPLFQSEFTAEILRLCKQNGIHTAVETSGFASESNLIKVLKYCDLVLFDIKETDNEKHLEYTGVSLDIILQNLKSVNDMKVPFVIRMPIIPGFNDRKEHFFKVKEIAKKLPFCRNLQIMPYHKLGEYKYQQLGKEYLCRNIVEPSKDDVEKWKSLLK